MVKMLRPRFLPASQPVRSPEAAKRDKLYRTARWRRTRLEQLAREPLCQRCRTRLATVVDHILGHAKDWEARFFELDGLQSLCAACHSWKTRQERPDIGRPDR